MHKKLIYLCFFLLFLIEGLVLQTLKQWEYSINIYPLIVFTFLVFITIYGNIKDASIVGLIFGLLYDIVYGRVLGVYTFGIVGIIFLIRLFIKYFHPTFILYLIIELLSISILELFLYGVLSLFRLVNIPFSYVIFNILVPTIIFNLVFAAIYYFAFKKIIENNNV